MVDFCRVAAHALGWYVLNVTPNSWEREREHFEVDTVELKRPE